MVPGYGEGPTQYVHGLILTLLLTLLVVSGVSFWGQATVAEVAAKERRFVKPAKQVLLPRNKEALSWRWTMRMVAWARGHNATGFEFNTPELVERRVKELKAQGYNTINDGSLFWNLAYTDRWDEGIAMSKMICESAHRHGMKVIHHMDVPVLTYMGTGLQYLTDHPEWLRRDIRYGIPSFSSMCLNNPGFRKEFLGRLVRFARETKIDGFMLDECVFPSIQYCGCPHCRKTFTEQTGCVLPTDPTSKVFFNRQSRLWVQWINWRLRSTGDWFVAVRKALNEANPNICLMTYTTHYGVCGSWVYQDFGTSLFEKARACDFIGSEIMSRNVFDTYRSVRSFRKITSAIGDHFGSATWGLVYHLDDRNIAYFGWALNQMNRQTTWMDIIPGVDMLRYQEWPHQVKKDRAGSMADTAVLFSSPWRDLPKEPSRFFDAEGYSQIMSDAHIQHDYILDDDVSRTKLRHYKLVILPSNRCMSRDQIEALRHYVSEGGALIVSGNTAMHDEEGFRTKGFQLADLTGVDYDPAGSVIKGPLLIKSHPNGKTYTYPEICFRRSLRKNANAEVLADILDKDRRSPAPAIVVNRYGKGKCIYLACRLGMVNCEVEHTANRKWTYEKNEELASLLLSVVRLSVNNNFDVNAVAVPERILMSVHRQKENGTENILVHFLNATGAARFKKGDIVPGRKPDDSFPALTEDMVFDIRAHGVTSAIIVSPDYAGERPVIMERRNNGYLRVTVRKEDLKAYGIVYLKTR